jgi:hypothetical protein
MVSALPDSSPAAPWFCFLLSECSVLYRGRLVLRVRHSTATQQSSLTCFATVSTFDRRLHELIEVGAGEVPSATRGDALAMPRGVIMVHSAT